MEVEKKKTRDCTLDVIRFIAIFMVVTIHVSNYYCRYMDDQGTISYFFAVLYNSLSRISVPLFFMISGALMLSKPQKDQKLLKKTLHFLQILVIWTVIYMIFDIVFMKYSFSVKEIVNLIFEPLKPHLWYMYAIISLYIVTPFAYILVENMGHKYENYFIILWFVATGGVKLLTIVLDYAGFENEITYNIPLVQGTYYMGYYMIGYLLYKRVHHGEFKRRRELVLLYIVSAIIVFVGTFMMSNYEEAYFGDLLTYRNMFVILASTSFFVIALKSEKYVPKKLAAFLGKISPHLFGVYLLHIIFFDLIIRTIHIKSVPALIGVPFFTTVIFTVTLLLVYGINKTPLGKYLF